MTSALLQIYWWFQQWKHAWNRPIFLTVMNEHVAAFLRTMV